MVYLVRIIEVWGVDIEIEAETQAEAQLKALDIQENHSTYMRDTSTDEFQRMELRQSVVLNPIQE